MYENHTQLQLYYDMSYSVSETAQTGTTTMTLSIEYPAGSGTQFEMTQSGSETMTGAAGGRLVTDLVTLPFTILAGTDFRIKGQQTTRQVSACPRMAPLVRTGPRTIW